MDDLRIDGTLREFADWQQVQDSCALDGPQIMELKRASLLFKRHETRNYGYLISVLAIEFSSRILSLTTSTFSTTRRDVSASLSSRLPFLRLRRLRQSLLRSGTSATFNFQVDIESVCCISGFKFCTQPHPPPKIVLPEFLCEVITVHYTAGPMVKHLI